MFSLCREVPSTIRIEGMFAPRIVEVKRAALVWTGNRARNMLASIITLVAFTCALATAFSVEACQSSGFISEAKSSSSHNCPSPTSFRRKTPLWIILGKHNPVETCFKDQGSGNFSCLWVMGLVSLHIPLADPHSTDTETQIIQVDLPDLTWTLPTVIIMFVICDLGISCLSIL